MNLIVMRYMNNPGMNSRENTRDESKDIFDRLLWKVIYRTNKLLFTFWLYQ